MSDYIYIVTSLPRSGTTSLCAMASNLGLKPMHVLQKNMSECIGEGYNFFADTPFYSPEFLIGILNFYKNIKFIYLERPLEKIKNSFENTILKDYFKSYFSYPVGKPLLFQDSIFYQSIHNCSNFLPNHKQYIEDISKNYNVDTLFYKFEDGWEPLCKFLEIDKVPNFKIPHLNKSPKIGEIYLPQK